MVSTFRYRSFKSWTCGAAAATSTCSASRSCSCVALQPECRCWPRPAFTRCRGPSPGVFGAAPAPGRRPPSPPAKPLTEPWPERPRGGRGRRRDPRWPGALIRRGQGAAARPWVVPGGTVELGESLERPSSARSGRRRGSWSRPGELLTVFDRIERDGDRVVYHYVIVDYLCDYVVRQAPGGSDAEDVAWSPRPTCRYDLPREGPGSRPGRVSRKASVS